MGPSDEPGESRVPPAEEATGLGGAGTEGKPGPPGTGEEMYPDIRFGSDDEARAAARRLQQALHAGELPMPDEEPRTGVGTPTESAVAGGAELGGDTGDVGTPRNEVGEHGGPGGTGVPMEVTPTDEAGQQRPIKPKRHAA